MSFMNTATNKNKIPGAGLIILLLLSAGVVPAQTAASPSGSGSPASTLRSSPATEDGLQPPAAVRPEAPQARGGFRRGERGVYKAQITPHWFQNNTRLWYRNDLAGGAKEFILVDAEAGTRKPAFDHEKLAAALSKAAGGEFKADRLPFSEIEFVEDGKAVKFAATNKTWRCDLNSYECVAVTNASSSRWSPPVDGPLLAVADATDGGESSLAGPPSPQAQNDQPAGTARGRGGRRGGGPVCVRRTKSGGRSCATTTSSSARHPATGKFN